MRGFNGVFLSTRLDGAFPGSVPDSLNQESREAKCQTGYLQRVTMGHYVSSDEKERLWGSVACGQCVQSGGVGSPLKSGVRKSIGWVYVCFNLSRVTLCEKI